MHHELKDWLETVVPPRRVELIDEAFEAMVSIGGYELDEIALNVANEIGRLDTISVLAKLNSDLIRYPEEVLANYGIFIDIDQATLETLPRLVDIMNTVRYLESWEETQEILTLYDEFEDSRELFAECCHVVTGCDVEDVLTLLRRVEESFIRALELELKRVGRVERLLNDTNITSNMSEFRIELANNLPEDSEVRAFMFVIGDSVIPWGNLAELKEGLAAKPTNKSTMIEWVALAAIAGYTNHKQVKTLILMEVELYLEDNVTAISEINRLLNSILVEGEQDEISN